LCARPASAGADSGRAKIPEGVRFAALWWRFQIKADVVRKTGIALVPRARARFAAATVLFVPPDLYDSRR
jgi:hypothetical protein